MHRVVEIAFQPQSARQWRLHGAVRKEAARLWSRLVRLHARIRRSRWKWPTKAKLEKWAKGKFPGLHSQSVQHVIDEFLEAVASSSSHRKAGNEQARYPWRQSRYRPVPFTNQAVRIKGDKILLPCGVVAGARAYMTIRVPDGLVLPGRVMEARLEFCKLALICEIPEAANDNQDEVHPIFRPKPPKIGVDLGVNTLIAATDGHRALLISGREAKALIQLRNKRLAEISALQAKRVKGSKRWKDLQWAKRSVLDRVKRQLDDLVHKATRMVADAFPSADAYVGAAFNDAAGKQRPRGAQTVSQALCGRITRLLAYKLRSATVIGEHFTSQTCPVCLERRKSSARLKRCVGCGYRVPRDVVGSTNIRTKGMHGRITRTLLPAIVTYRQPRRLGPSPTSGLRYGRSSGGHPTSGSQQDALPQAA